MTDEISSRRPPSPARWRPSLGAVPVDGGTSFRLWAPAARRVDLRLEDGRSSPLAPVEGGYHETILPGVGAGALYRYALDGRGPFPDPASRRQPLGVHGPSEVVDPRAFSWTDETWRGRSLQDLVIYELHVGTFSTEGTFAGALSRLPSVVELGATAIELMPVAAFPGERNWGYDGVALFAPAGCYGTPDDLRRLVDGAHHLGLAVILDVVYNHLGPDGNYLGAFSPFYFTDRHQTPWGQALNFDGDGSRPVRAFFIENACHWLAEYHLDGLRLDAVHAIIDEGAGPHIMADLAAAARRVPGPRRLVIAEDNRNLATLLRPADQGGFDLDGVWADDFHHQIRRRLAGDRDGYYVDYEGSSSDIAETVRRGWFFCGQHAAYHDRPRGTDPSGLPAAGFVICLQNHDQIGNRAFGERLHHQIDAPAFRAATALLLLAPETPLLFMGQEWAASAPFLYFTDHHEELGRLVTAGRREEFKRFAAFSDPAMRARIPDPQAAETFSRSRLDWEEWDREPHAQTFRLHQALLGLRRSAFSQEASEARVEAAGRQGLLLWRGQMLLAVQLEAAGEMVLDEPVSTEPLLSTEDARYTVDPAPIEIVTGTEKTHLRFRRPGAVVFRRTSRGGP